MWFSFRVMQYTDKSISLINEDLKEQELGSMELNRKIHNRTQ